MKGHISGSLDSHLALFSRLLFLGETRFLHRKNRVNKTHPLRLLCCLSEARQPARSVVSGPGQGSESPLPPPSEVFIENQEDPVGQVLCWP